MVKKFPDLERGESASLTGRDHIPPRVFKEMTRLTKQKSKLEDLLTGINPFNAKSPGGGNLQDSGYLYSQRGEDGHTADGKYGVSLQRKQTSENKKLKTKKCRTGKNLLHRRRRSAP